VHLVELSGALLGGTLMIREPICRYAAAKVRQSLQEAFG